ncbi:MAG: zinc ribbon domain-containing protein [Myxococcales bacterium]|nr:zinc ribbon domain-containing protein [Myxococcales bacterium]
MLLFLAIAAGLASAYLLVQALRPLLESSVVTAADWQRVEDESADLLARRDRLVEELRDLEFEAALNKVNAQDLAELRARYEAEAVALVRTLDERASDFDGRIEAEVSARLEKAEAARAAKAAGDAARRGGAPPEPAGGAAPEAAPAPPPAEPAAAPAVALEKAPAPAEGPRCAACGAGVAPDDAFCDACGAPQQPQPACPSCGEENRPGARFCRKCGAGLEEGVA